MRAAAVAVAALATAVAAAFLLLPLVALFLRVPLGSAQPLDLGARDDAAVGGVALDVDAPLPIPAP